MIHGARRSLRLVALLGVFIALFAASLTLVFTLPDQPIAVNVRASVPRLKAEGAYPRPFIDSAAFQLDNVTDSLMLDVALGGQEGGPFTESVAMVRGVLPPDVRSGDPVRLLEDSASGTRPYPEAYARYWHGYQVVLRPALALFTYQDIRYLNMVAFGLLVAVLIALTWIRVGPDTTIALVLSLLLSGFMVIPLSLQFSGVAYLALLGSLAVVLFAGTMTTRRGDLESFLALGALTAFVDLLTAPLMTLGLPLGIALAVRARRDPHASLRDDLVFSARAVAAWGVGYAVAWGAKWAIGGVVLGSEVFGGAARQALLWTGGTASTSVVGEALKVNLMNLLPLVRFDPAISGLARYVRVGPVAWIALGAIIVTAVLLIRFRRPRPQVVRAAGVLLLIPLPYAWIALLSTHSKLHFAFTYRVQVFAVFAVVYFIGASVDWARVRCAVLGMAGPFRRADPGT